MHDVVIVSVPLIAILAGIFLNRADVKELGNEIKELRSEMNARFNAVESRFNAVESRFNAIVAELRYFHGVTGKLDGRIESLEKR